MAATRLLRVLKLPTEIGFSKETVSSSSFPLMGSWHMTQMCLRDIGLSSDTQTRTVRGGCKQTTTSPSACVLISEPKMNKMVDFALLFANIAKVMSQWLEFITRRRPWRFHVQMLVEKVIIDCRFFALLATWFRALLRSGVFSDTWVIFPILPCHVQDVRTRAHHAPINRSY